MRRTFRASVGLAAILAPLHSAGALQPPREANESIKAAPRRVPDIRLTPPLPPPGRFTLGKSIQVQKILSIPDGFFWDSGEQQCQIAGRKLIYHYWKEPSDDDPNYLWRIRYDVRTEFNSTTGWANDHALYSLYYFFTYAGGAKPNDTNSKYLNNATRHTGILLRGNDYTPFGMQVITLKRGGGASGFEVTWPNSSGCRVSPR